jgi:hypothetical protein
MGILLGCDHPVQRRLEGRWLGESVENVELSKLANATGWVKGTAFEFERDAVTIAIPGELPRSAPYKVLRADHGRVTIQMQRGNGAVDVARFTLDDDHLLRWHLTGGRAVVLRRAL